MIEIIPLDDLGHADHGWINAHHHFSFANYVDPDRMGIGPLRVWNDDHIRAGEGFPTHPHQDMEIITYVRKGAITHEDSLGNVGRTVAGDVQVMSAGTGIKHSEYNLEDEETELFQIWIFPDAKGHAPRWEARSFPKEGRNAALVPLASGQEGVDGALMIHQDATLFGGALSTGQTVDHALPAGRQAYLVAPFGRIKVNGQEVPARAGVVIGDDESEVRIEALEACEVILCDLPL